MTVARALDPVIVREAAAFAGLATLDSRSIGLAGLLAVRVETVLVRAADAEPPLETEAAVAGGRAGNLAEGLEAVMAATGASSARILLSERHAWIAGAVRAALEEAGAPPTVELELLPDRGGIAELIGPSGPRVQPALVGDGDAAGRGQAAAGALVLSAQELVLLADALRGRRMTHRTITLWGELRGPRVLRVPLGTAFGDLPAMAGGASVRRWVFVEGGGLRGRVRRGADAVVGLATDGVGLIPADHALVRRLETPTQHHRKRALSACTNCTACTDVCPPHLLGLDLEPHRLMRLLARGARADHDRAGAAHCIACQLCTARCPAELDPGRIVSGLSTSVPGAERCQAPFPAAHFPAALRVPRAWLEARYGMTRWRVPEELAQDPALPGRGLASAAEAQPIGIPRPRRW